MEFVIKVSYYYYGQHVSYVIALEDGNYKLTSNHKDATIFTKYSKYLKVYEYLKLRYYRQIELETIVTEDLLDKLQTI